MSRARATYGIRLLFDRRVQLALALALLIVAGGLRLGQVIYSGGIYEVGYDFAAYWLAADQLLQGSSVYAPEQLTGPYPAQQQYMYLYPPFLAVLVIPFALAFADYVSAAWAWAWLGLAVLVLSVLIVARAERLGWPMAIGLLAAALALPPVALELFIGNVHAILLGLLGLAWLGVRRGGMIGDSAVAVAVAVAALIKLFPIMLIRWLWLTGRRRAAGMTIAAAASLVLVTVPLTGVSDWLAYPLVLLNLSPAEDPASVLAPTAWLTGAMGFTAARALVTGVGLLVLAWSALRQPLEVSYGIAVLVSLLVVPALYMHYLTLAVLPLLLFASQAQRQVWALLAYAILFVGTQLVLWTPESTSARAAGTVAAICLLTLMLVAPKFARPKLRVAAQGGA